MKLLNKALAAIKQANWYIANALISAGIVLIVAPLTLRDKVTGGWKPQSVGTSVALCVLGLLLTFPVSVPCLLLGILFRTLA